jgi:hypothetical protein
VAATLQENQSLQLGEDALVPAHTYERSIAEACTRVQHKSLTPPHCELRPPVNLLRCKRHRCIIACSCWGPRHSSSGNRNLAMTQRSVAATATAMAILAD